MLVSHQMRFYHSSTDAWHAMSQACTMAKKSIDFEEYILRDDAVGNQLLEIFMAKAREGLRVRLLLDAFGCRRMRRHKVIVDLYEAGVQLAFFRPLNFLQVMIPTLGLPRSHAKALHIDGKTSFIGSMCVAAHMQGWRDTLVALEGEVAIQAKEDFNREWCREVLNFSYKPPPSPSCTNSPRSQRYKNDYTAQIPTFAITAILDSLKARIETATTSVLIATPYFFPTGCLRHALIAARARGVSVTLMLASQTDIPLADTVTRGLVKDWRKLGFNVVFYQPHVLHAKYAIIDEDWATVGSCNFDLLSLKFNREANVVLGELKHVQEFVRQSREVLANCAPIPASNGVQNVWDKSVGKFGALVCRLF
jgi:cardiolipin synthase A/B